MEQKLDFYFGHHLNDHTNEPSHATAFVYLYANAPSKAQSTIRSILKKNYFNNPVGLLGNDDCGQMSAWYVLNTLGFYPVNPASGEYVIGTPAFNKATVRFPLAHSSDEYSELIIEANGAADNPFVGGVALDGTPLVAPIISHKALVRASRLSFDMSDEPQTWSIGTL
jgi:putative alpha-1,2-mannosidase